MHLVPSTKLLFGAVDGQTGTVNAGDGQDNVIFVEDIVIEEVIDDGRKENDGPEIDETAPKAESPYPFGHIQDEFHEDMIPQDKTRLSAGFVRENGSTRLTGNDKWRSWQADIPQRFLKLPCYRHMRC